MFILDMVFGNNIRLDHPRISFLLNGKGLEMPGSLAFLSLWVYVLMHFFLEFLFYFVSHLCA